MKLKINRHRVIVTEGENNPAPTPAPEAKTFTQEDINRIVAEEKRQYTKKMGELTSQLESLRKSQGLTTEERAALEARIEELNNANLTKDQIAAKEKKKIETDYANKLSAVEETAKSWQTRYSNLYIDNTLLNEATASEAYNSEQMVQFLRPMTKLVEEIGADSKPTGNFLVKISLQDKNEKGERVNLTLSPSEALKLMKEKPEYTNLFKSKQGLGMNTVGTGGKLDLSNPAVYREARKQPGFLDNLDAQRRRN